MATETQRREAETLFVGLRTGCASREEIGLWAEKIVMANDVPDAEFLDLCWNLEVSNLLSQLQQISLGQHHFEACRIVLGRMAILGTADAGRLHDFASALYQLATERNDWPNDLLCLYSFDDEYRLFESGIRRLEDADRVFLSALSGFKRKESREPNWYKCQ